jgi:hypothetical protein
MPSPGVPGTLRRINSEGMRRIDPEDRPMRRIDLGFSDPTKAGKA